MQLIPLMNVHLDLREPFDVGEGPFGKRVVYDVNGGTFDGDRLRGRVLPSGGDWVLFDTDGVARLDVRVTLQTHDEALIYMHYNGVLVPKSKNVRVFAHEIRVSENVWEFSTVLSCDSKNVRILKCLTRDDLLGQTVDFR